jgi:hypothetical protein
MLAVSAASVAFAAPHGPALEITVAEASHAIQNQIFRKVKHRLGARYMRSTNCTGPRISSAPVTQTSLSPRWRCMLEVSGRRFPMPCKAEAYALGTSTAHVVRVQWLAISRYCRS